VLNTPFEECVQNYVAEVRVNLKLKYLETFLDIFGHYLSYFWHTNSFFQNKKLIF
jgi:hypothetical protein